MIFESRWHQPSAIIDRSHVVTALLTPDGVGTTAAPRAGATAAPEERDGVRKSPRSINPAVMPVLGKCTACAEDALPNAEGDAYVHPNLGVLLCERCYDRNTRVFEKDVRDALYDCLSFDPITVILHRTAALRAQQLRTSPLTLLCGTGRWLRNAM